MRVPHAINRALERYGIKLTHKDLADLCAECLKGYGRLAYLPDGKERHLLMHSGKAIVVVFKPYDGKSVLQKEGRIITVLPRSAASPGAKGSPATAVNKKRMKPPKRAPKRSRLKNWR